MCGCKVGCCNCNEPLLVPKVVQLTKYLFVRKDLLNKIVYIVYNNYRVGSTIKLEHDAEIWVEGMKPQEIIDKLKG